MSDVSRSRLALESKRRFMRGPHRQQLLVRISPCHANYCPSSHEGCITTRHPPKGSRPRLLAPSPARRKLYSTSGRLLVPAKFASWVIVRAGAKHHGSNQRPIHILPSFSAKLHLPITQMPDSARNVPQKILTRMGRAQDRLTVCPLPPRARAKRTIAG